jgi:CDP-glycerol glycerophosphotransferase
MVFLVPDLARYDSDVRGFLYDFRSTAPGPLLDSSADVVEALRDLDGVSRRYRADYDTFNQRYNALQDGHATERVVQGFFG